MKPEERFLSHMAKVTVKLLRGIDEQPIPTGSRCGFITRRNGRLIVVTAAHKADLDDHWFVQTSLTHEGQTLFVPVKGMIFWKRLRLDSPEQVEDIDLAWGELDLEVLRDQLKAKGIAVDRPLGWVPYIGPIETPDRDEAYGFSGVSSIDFVPSFGEMHQTPAYELFLEYTGDDSQGDKYEFAMSRKHHGHEYYQGASGSPIAGPDGKIVSILLGGDEERNVLWGAKLLSYERLWDVDFNPAAE